MYIHSVLSFLGAWQKISVDRPTLLDDLNRVLNAVDAQMLPGGQGANDVFGRAFRAHDWLPGPKVPIGRGNNRHAMEVDFIRDKVGVEVHFGKTERADSFLFVLCPYLIRDGQCQIGLLLAPMKSLTSELSARVSSYEIIRDRLSDLYPLPVKYPFAIAGLSSVESHIQVEELTSDLDQYLITITGQTLDEMVRAHEQVNYDFKQEMPKPPNKIGHLACAFANLQGGGIILFGIDNAGNLVGVPRGEALDKTRSQVEGMIKQCAPRPHCEARIFDVPGRTDHCILTFHINEVARKPCMSDERVYIRAGTSAEAAGSDQIRRLVIQSLEANEPS